MLGARIFDTADFPRCDSLVSESITIKIDCPSADGARGYRLRSIPSDHKRLADVARGPMTRCTMSQTDESIYDGTFQKMMAPRHLQTTVAYSVSCRDTHQSKHLSLTAYNAYIYIIIAPRHHCTRRLYSSHSISVHARNNIECSRKKVKNF